MTSEQPYPVFEPVALEVLPDAPEDPLSAVSEDAARQWNDALWSPRPPC